MADPQYRTWPFPVPASIEDHAAIDPKALVSDVHDYLLNGSLDGLDGVSAMNIFTLGDNPRVALVVLLVQSVGDPRVLMGTYDWTVAQPISEDSAPAIGTQEVS